MAPLIRPDATLNFNVLTVRNDSPWQAMLGLISPLLF
jgi:hypothetical protein